MYVFYATGRHLLITLLCIQIFRADQLPFTQIPELVNHFLQPADPIVLFYTIKPNEPPPATLQVWDVEVKVEDTFLKNRMNQVILSMNNETAQELLKYEQEVCSLRTSNPVPCLTFSFPGGYTGATNTKLAAQANIFDVVRRRPSWVHQQVARIPVQGSGFCSQLGSKRGTDSSGRRAEAE